jgi:protein SCO1/2
VTTKRLFALLLLFLFGGAVLAAGDAAALKAGVFTPPRLAPEIALRGSDGADLKLARFRGKVVLMFFGFTHCADVCPVTLAVLAQARQQLGARASEVQVVYVTVDPERDDAAHLKKYLAAFDASFVGATGKPEALAAVRDSYGVSARKIGSGTEGYAIAHSSSVYLIDPEGRLRAMMPFGHSAADYVHDVGLLLRK